MMNGKDNISMCERNPILIGVFTVLTTVTLGMSLAFALGLTTPKQVFAQMADIVPVDPCCAIIPVVPAPVVEPAPVVTPVAGITPVDPCCTLTPVPTVAPVVAPVVAQTTPIVPAPVVPIVPVVPPIVPPLQGCTDPVATNYNAAAVVNDGSCTYPPALCTDHAAANYGGALPCVYPPALCQDHSATNYGGALPCTYPQTPTAPTCTLALGSSSIVSGSSSALSWTTTNATGLTINQSIGAVTPVAAGSTTISPTVTTTYTGTVTGAGGSATCTATLTVTTGGGAGGPACTLSANPTTVSSGGTSTLSWTTSSATSFIISGIGTISTIASGSTTTPALSTSTTYTGTARDASGASATCAVTVTIQGGGGGCTSNCGGGSGGGPVTPLVTLSALPHPAVQPLAYLYLSQIPYTGLDLGPVGTALYWVALIGWSLVIAYFVLFGAVPFVSRSARTFGDRVSEALNAREYATASVVPVAAPAPQVFHDEIAPEAPRYSPYDGFKSFARNGALSVDDIVKGLSQQKSVASAPVAPAPVAYQAPIAHVEPVYENIEPIERMEMEGEAVEPATIPADIRGFASALVQGDRAAVFAGLRQHVRGGGNAEQLISSIACVLDETYRARVEGTPCDPALARLTARFSSTTLEKLIGALAIAIDSSYTDQVTGAKLSLTRALAVIGA